MSHLDAALGAFCVTAASFEIVGLTFGYPKRTPIFRDFAFRTEARVTVLRGPSGCGKTTLLKIAAGLLPPKVAPAQVSQHTHLVLQSDILPGWLSPRSFLKLFAPHLLDSIQASDIYPLISPYWERRAADLSYGQRRTFELSCALEARPTLLLLDEPFNFLDRGRRAAFAEILGNPAKCPGPVLLTSHYDEEASVAGAQVFEFTGDPPYLQLTPVCR